MPHVFPNPLHCFSRCDVCRREKKNGNGLNTCSCSCWICCCAAAFASVGEGANTFGIFDAHLHVNAKESKMEWIINPSIFFTVLEPTIPFSAMSRRNSSPLLFRTAPLVIPLQFFCLLSKYSVAILFFPEPHLFVSYYSTFLLRITLFSSLRS